MLGFRVASIERTLAALGPCSAPVLAGPTEDAWGRRVVPEDPDGRAVELREVLSSHGNVVDSGATCLREI